MIEPRSALEPSRAMFSELLRRLVALLVGAAALAVGLGFLWGTYQHTSEREAAMRRLKTHGYGWVSETLKRIAERNDRDVEVIREIADETTRLLSDVLTRRRMSDPALRLVVGPELASYVQGKRYR